MDHYLYTGDKPLSAIPIFNQGILRGGSITVPLTSLFDWFGISCMTTDNFCFYLQNRLIQTSQTEVKSTVILPSLVFPDSTSPNNIVRKVLLSRINGIYYWRSFHKTHETHEDQLFTINQINIKWKLFTKIIIEWRREFFNLIKLLLHP